MLVQRLARQEGGYGDLAGLFDLFDILITPLQRLGGQEGGHGDLAGLFDLLEANHNPDSLGLPPFSCVAFNGNLLAAGVWMQGGK
eukprot:390042-Pelagomonas_calceolata.AAC.1